MAWFEHGTSRINYEDQGSGEPILLLTGFADQIEGHFPLRNALLQAGYRVIAADIPGSGHSQPIPRKYTARYFEDDARGFSDLLRQIDAAPAHLIGWSTGGNTALLMAAQTPEIARSVMTWGAVGTVTDPTGQIRAVMDKIVDDPIPPLREYSQYMIATYGKDNARAMVLNINAAITEIIDTRGGDVSLSQAGKITCPVLLIAGEHDMFVSPEQLAEAATHFPNVKTLGLNDAGHNLHMTHSDWFVQTALDWMKQQQKISA